MATWKSENSLLTLMGVEILNKVKAGIGSITVTRVVAGSGRVAESQLFRQTALSGNTKPMVISSKSIKDDGSEISTYISNADFTQPFNLIQIGIFVSHEDYEGEVLYHISQCEEDGFDVIPALDETPVNFGYNIFLEHGNSSSINITVDPQGAVKVTDFEKFKNEMVLPNLLDNWYFVNPVKTGANRRLVNRWNCVAGSIELTEQGIKINKADSIYGYGSFETQLFNRPDLLGKQITVSVLTTEGLFSRTGVVAVRDSDSATVKYNSSNNSCFRVYFNNNHVYGEFLSYSDNEPVIIAVKAELGSQQTLAHQDLDGNWVLNEIPNFADEVAKCAQYSSTYGNYLGVVPYGLISGEASSQTSETFYTTLLNWFNLMGNRQIQNFVFHSNGGFVLEGGSWIITIDKLDSKYGSIVAKKYLSNAAGPGISIKTCSIFDGSFTNWGTLSSGIVPASVE